MPCDSWDVTTANPRSEHVTAIRNHLFILADRNRKVSNFIELWIAHMLHHPAMKPNAWLVLMSEEGAGKGTLVRIIKALVGIQKVKEICNVRRSLLGQFNQVMLDAFLVVIDEGAGKDMFELMEELKHLITEDTVPVNQKNVAEKTVRSYARFMMTIQPRAVPTKKGDRRGVIIRCSDELIGDKAHWKDINARIDDQQALADIHAYLMMLQPPPKFLPGDLPQTEVQRELQNANADVFESWIGHTVDKWLGDEPGCGHVLNNYKGKRDSANILPEFVVQDLYASFRDFATRSNASKQVEGITFPRFVSRFSICRWRKAFDWKPNGSLYPKHKINGVQQQCRRWDMATLARDLGVDMATKESKNAKIDTFMKTKTHPEHCCCRRCSATDEQ